ncbi:signal peptidase I [Thermomonas sp.]|uniref:signal peptidase I n=1 Tax=Thermomonas sp. TaxID=1971895 RepID=UPI0024881DA0|nr:signal peptidase I [Thermomonas sp.]MDI1253771.1 signal peptidase I [Thermomonas sp.]
MVWFETILVSLTALTGLIWLLDKLFLAKRRAAAAGLLEEPKEPIVVDYAKAFFPILALVLGLRSFVAEPFRIPSSSMMPTLLTGDFILVNKFAFGLRWPITNKKFLDIGEPQRGDVVVFHPPQLPKEDWIKRIIGLPGDTIGFHDNKVTINGRVLPYRNEGEYLGTGEGTPETGSTKLTESLPGRPHFVLEWEYNRGDGDWTVPAGHYFVMGDNRDNSEDGRFWPTHFLPEANLRGKAFLIWMNFDRTADHVVDVSRIGTRIH